MARIPKHLPYIRPKSGRVPYSGCLSFLDLLPYELLSLIVLQMIGVNDRSRIYIAGLIIDNDETLRSFF